MSPVLRIVLRIPRDRRPRRRRNSPWLSPRSAAMIPARAARLLDRLETSSTSGTRDRPARARLLGESCSPRSSLRRRLVPEGRESPASSSPSSTRRGFHGDSAGPLARGRPFATFVAGRRSLRCSRRRPHAHAQKHRAQELTRRPLARPRTGALALFPNLLYHCCDGPEAPFFGRLLRFDPGKLAEFQAGIRKRYLGWKQIVGELIASRRAARPLTDDGASSRANPATSVPPADGDRALSGRGMPPSGPPGLVPPPLCGPRDELLGPAPRTGGGAGPARRPPATSTSTRGRLPLEVALLLAHGSARFSNALREGRASTCRSGKSGLEAAPSSREPCSPGSSAACRRFADWAEGAEAGRRPPHGVAGLPDARCAPRRRGSTFQFLVGERLGEQGVAVGTDGRLGKKKGAPRRRVPARAARQEMPSCGALTAGSNDRVRGNPGRSGTSSIAPPARRGARGRCPRRSRAWRSFTWTYCSTTSRRDAGRGEEELVLAGADPERPAGAAGGEEPCRGYGSRAHCRRE